MIKKFNYFLQAIIIYLFFIIGRILGIKISRNVFSFLFSLLGPLIKSKKIVNNNLKIFFKKNSKFNKDEIINNMWKNYGMTFIEYIFLDNFFKKKTEVEIIGEINLTDVIRGKNPAIFISGHFANFELMSMEITKKKY